MYCSGSCLNANSGREGNNHDGDRSPALLPYCLSPLPPAQTARASLLPFCSSLNVAFFCLALPSTSLSLNVWQIPSNNEITFLRKKKEKKKKKKDLKSESQSSFKRKGEKGVERKDKRSKKQEKGGKQGRGKGEGGQRERRGRNRTEKS